MHSDHHPTGGGPNTLAPSSVLDDPRRRRILCRLLEQSRPLTLRELAIELAARETGEPPSELPQGDITPIRVDLEHRCLPTLEERGWITRTPDGVVVADPLPLGDGDSLRADLRERDQRFWDGVAALGARPRRQELVSILAEHRHSLAVSDLATELAERGRPARDGADTDLSLAGLLHHVDLPPLAEAGLVEYDPTERNVSRTRRLLMVGDWLGLDTGLPQQ